MSCVSIAAEVFDITGLVAPILRGIKIDNSCLYQRHLDWDDPIPNELKKYMDLINEIGNLTFRRTVIPVNAISLDIETIDTAANAGENLICSAIYEQRNGEYSCQ